MALNDRERFILHSVSASFLLTDFNDKITLGKVIEYISKNRCRKLSKEDVLGMMNDIKDELLLTKGVWDEFGSDNKIDTTRI